MKNSLLLIFLFCFSSAFAQTQKDSLINQPSFVKEETEQGKDFMLYRTIVNVNGVLTTFEKKVWNWGGVFVFKNGHAYPVEEGKELPIITWEREKNEMIKKAGE